MGKIQVTAWAEFFTPPRGGQFSQRRFTKELQNAFDINRSPRAGPVLPADPQWLSTPVEITKMRDRILDHRIVGVVQPLVEQAVDGCNIRTD